MTKKIKNIPVTLEIIKFTVKHYHSVFTMDGKDYPQTSHTYDTDGEDFNIKATASQYEAVRKLMKYAAIEWNDGDIGILTIKKTAPLQLSSGRSLEYKTLSVDVHKANFKWADYFGRPVYHIIGTRGKVTTYDTRYL